MLSDRYRVNCVQCWIVDSESERREHYLNVVHISINQLRIFYLNFANKTPWTLLKINVENYFSCQIFSKKNIFYELTSKFWKLILSGTLETFLWGTLHPFVLKLVQYCSFRTAIVKLYIVYVHYCCPISRFGILR